MKKTDCFDDSVLKKASSLRNKDYGTYGVCIPTQCSPHPPPAHSPAALYTSWYLLRNQNCSQVYTRKQLNNYLCITFPVVKDKWVSFLIDNNSQ